MKFWRANAPAPAVLASRCWMDSTKLGNPSPKNPCPVLPANYGHYTETMTDPQLNSEPADTDPPVHEARTWQDKGWTAQVIKNEDDDGWAVAMYKQGHDEPALVGPWTMGRDKKNPKPLDTNAPTTTTPARG